MSFASKALIYWLAYAVILSVVIGLAVGQAKSNHQSIDIYKEIIQ